MIAERKDTSARCWAPPAGEPFDTLEDIVRHNLTASAGQRVGAPRLVELFKDEFAVTVSQSAMGRYMKARTRELGSK